MKKLLLIFAVLLGSIATFAQPRNEQQAKQITGDSFEKKPQKETHVKAQTPALKQMDFDLFCIKVPQKCKLLNENVYPEYDNMLCKTYTTPNEEFFFTYCIFDIDKDFDLEQRLRGEAWEMANIDIDEVGFFGVATGTDHPLLSTIADIPNCNIAIGIYPHYDKGKGIYVCLIDMNKIENAFLMTLMSSFRPVK